MPARNMLFVPGGYYHFYNRGANRISLFHQEANYRYVLRLLKRYCAQFQISIIAYCLLPNHYHWLVRQDGPHAARLLPQRVFNAYSHALHNDDGHTGTLFEGPYRAIKVDSDEYLRHLCRYIHANPVRHGFAYDAALWPYSNYLEWIGKRAGTLVDREFIAAHFPTVEHYQAYVTVYLRGQAASPSGLAPYLAHLDAVGP
jgi:REP element-mobilizing transposase RayT